ncbi:hypothetical protein [Aureimonas psammosilenae]|uniref:hypothetical protein n=1 Tax=Aureimonas psammosilenae TaxID=2495496 RepID=UPI001261195F|nr:hypothetical protein [Aureimonas psammosilenae]
MTLLFPPSLALLSDLEAPMLDLSSGAAPEAVLDRLRLQNFALERLREALAREEVRPRGDLSLVA